MSTNSNLFPNFDDVQKKSQTAVVLLVVLMMASAAVSYTQFLQRVFLGWKIGVFPVFCGLLSLEAFYVHTKTKTHEPRQRWLFHIAEWITILVLLKVLVYVTGGSVSFIADLGQWENNFSSFFTEPHYLMTLVPVLGIWVLSTGFAFDLDRLQLDSEELYLENHELVERDRRDIRRRMIEIVMFIGAGVLLLAVMVRTDLGGLGQTLQLGAAMQAPVINVVVYFLLALMLLSQTQFDYLRGSWMWSGVPVSLRMGWAWVRYGLIFFAVVALVAYVLPTRYTVGFLEVAKIVLDWFMLVAMGLLTLIFLPIYKLMAWLFELFGSKSPVEPAPQTNLQQLFPPANQTSTPVPWLEVLKSLVFWTVFVGVIGYFLLYYLRQNRELWAKLTQFPILRWVMEWFTGLKKWFRAANLRVGEAIKAGRERLFPQAAARMAGLLRPGIQFRNLNSRQKVIFFYLNLVQRGSQRGVVRRVSQTPSDYTQNLSQSFPEVKTELEDLTGAFMEARYSLHEVNDEHVGWVQQQWRRVMEALKKIGE
jgi:hypothetical protein